MNKKAETAPLQAVIGLAFGALAILLISALIYKFVSIFPTDNDSIPEQGGFEAFKKNIDFVMSKEESKSFELKANSDELIFGLSKKGMPVSESEFGLSKPIEFSYIKRPSKCNNGQACICKCKPDISKINKKEVSCKEEGLDCLNIDELFNLNDFFIYKGNCIELSEDGVLWSSVSYQQNNNYFTTYTNLKIDRLKLFVRCKDVNIRAPIR